MAANGDNFTYQCYLKLPQLLSLQQPVTEAEAELLFITVHQCIELLWRVVLCSNDRATQSMQENNPTGAAQRLERSTEIMQAVTTTAQLLATMTTQEFEEFRTELGTASGLQSNQFRELEIQGGIGDASLLNSYATDSIEYRAVKARLDGTNLRKAFHELIEREIPQANGNLTAVIRRLYKEHQFRDLATVANALYRYDEAFGAFRWSHFQLVKRIIGGAVGTGGTSTYLQKKLLSRFFPELVDFRTDTFRW